jgi:hypothetical protein
MKPGKTNIFFQIIGRYKPTKICTKCTGTQKHIFHIQIQKKPRNAQPGVLRTPRGEQARTMRPTILFAINSLIVAMMRCVAAAPALNTKMPTSASLYSRMSKRCKRKLTDKPVPDTRKKAQKDRDICAEIIL